MAAKDICAPRRAKGGKDCTAITFRKGKSGRKLANPVKVCRCASAAGKYKSASFRQKMRQRFMGHGTTLAGKQAKGVCINASTLKFMRCPKQAVIKGIKWKAPKKAK